MIAFLGELRTCRHRRDAELGAAAARDGDAARGLSRQSVGRGLTIQLMLWPPRMLVKLPMNERTLPKRSGRRKASVNAQIPPLEPLRAQQPFLCEEIRNPF